MCRLLTLNTCIRKLQSLSLVGIFKYTTWITNALTLQAQVNFTFKYLWKVGAETWKRSGFLASEEEKFNLGPETRLAHSELLCNKVLLKYKRDRESFWHTHQKGAERVPPCQSLVECYTATSRLLIRERECLKTQKLAPDPTSTTCILR